MIWRKYLNLILITTQKVREHGRYNLQSDWSGWEDCSRTVSELLQHFLGPSVDISIQIKYCLEGFATISTCNFKLMGMWCDWETWRRLRHISIVTELLIAFLYPTVEHCCDEKCGECPDPSCLECDHHSKTCKCDCDCCGKEKCCCTKDDKRICVEPKC